MAQGVSGLVSAHWLVELHSRLSGFRALRVPEFVSAHWCAGLVPGPSGGQSQILVWRGWVPVLISWSEVCKMMLARTSVQMVEQTLRRSCHQCLCLQGEFQLLLLLWEALQDQQVCLTQDPFKLFLLPCLPEHVRFCVHPLVVKSLFTTALWDS